MIKTLFAKDREVHEPGCVGRRLRAPDEIRVDPLTCTCPFRVRPGLEWVVGHEEGCDTLDLGPELGPSTKPCNCRHKNLKIAPFWDGVMCWVWKGDLYRWDNSVPEGIHEPPQQWLPVTGQGSLSEIHSGGPEFQPYREAWDNLVAKTVADGIKKDFAELERQGGTETEWTDVDHPPNGFYCLLGPGITRGGVVGFGCDCSHDGWHDYDTEHACQKCNPHALLTPELRRLEAITFKFNTSNSNWHKVVRAKMDLFDPPLHALIAYTKDAENQGRLDQVAVVYREDL